MAESASTAEAIKSVGKVVKITGEVTNSRACMTTDPNEYFDFEVIAPYMENADVPDNLSVFGSIQRLLYGLWRRRRLPQDHPLPQCPSPEASGPAYFGRTPGTISPEEAKENRSKILAEQQGQA